MTNIKKIELYPKSIYRRFSVCVMAVLLSYLLFLDTIEYDGKWYIEQFGGDIGSLLGIDIFSRGILSTELYDEINLQEIIVSVE
jgi:hypothetical protein